MINEADLPKCYICYDTLTGKYIKGSRGSLVFMSEGGLKVSIFPKIKKLHDEYTALIQYSLVKRANKEHPLVITYEKLVKKYGSACIEYNRVATQTDKYISENLLNALSSLTHTCYNGKSDYDYFDSFTFNDQSRYIIRMMGGHQYDESTGDNR